jgi:hypothetical protein
MHEKYLFQYITYQFDVSSRQKSNNHKLFRETNYWNHQQRDLELNDMQYLYFSMNIKIIMKVIVIAHSLLTLLWSLN